MKTIQMTIDDELLHAVDKVVSTLDTTRSAFIRDALRAALRQQAIMQMERQHAAGYKAQPTETEEFDEWEPERVWGDS